MHVRQAKRGDVDTIERIVRAAYAPYVPRIGREPAPMRADYGTLIRAGCVWVADATEAAAGIVVLLARDKHLLLDNLAVAPEAQRRGIGRGLADFAETEARRRGYSRIVLYTNVAMTRNVALYRRWGWRETHRAEEDGYARVYMAKDV